MSLLNKPAFIMHIRSAVLILKQFTHAARLHGSVGNQLHWNWMLK
ncbi:hypothetical protein BTN49_1960 [Candidatus Enterovibrio escicola]|uniref:Uncharacterized protein n=1 Tax=Candidatus Enterovibrio escicola TaxID=1927127 RepID=A0A2A5T2R0_9GAMM|nr:hypothetical protein BTN49_1960 [Candidatus Enterovibrio escacola]